MRIGDRMTVSWREEHDIITCYRDCDLCGTETPTPTADEMVAFIIENPGETHMWPGEKWLPDDWSLDPMVAAPGDKNGLLCQTCTRAKRRVIDGMRIK